MLRSRHAATRPTFLTSARTGTRTGRRHSGASACSPAGARKPRQYRLHATAAKPRPPGARGARCRYGWHYGTARTMGECVGRAYDTSPSQIGIVGVARAALPQAIRYDSQPAFPLSRPPLPCLAPDEAKSSPPLRCRQLSTEGTKSSPPRHRQRPAAEGTPLFSP